MIRLPPDNFTRKLAAHLLRRAAFGGTPAEIDRLHGLGLEAAVGELVDYTPSSDAAVAFEYISPRGSKRGALRRLPKEERKPVRNELKRRDRQQLQALRAWWLQRMVTTRSPLEEKMTLFWHGHFTSGYRDVKNSYHLFLQNRLLRRYATGSFGDLLRQVARDPAMLEYLDNKVNRKGKPNENFARELMELFTLGIGNYTERDVKEVARAFTGWTLDGDRFVFRRHWHDNETKTVLGATGRFEGDDVIDIILSKRVTAETIAAKVFKHFAHDYPGPGLIRALGQTLRVNDYQIKPLLRAIFLSKEFYSERSLGTRIKSPVELIVSTLKAAEIEPGVLSLPLAKAAGDLGQALFEPPNVKGWPGDRDWISTSTLFKRYNLAASIFANPRQVAKKARQARNRGSRARGRAPKDVPEDMMHEATEDTNRAFDAILDADPVTFDVIAFARPLRTTCDSERHTTGSCSNSGTDSMRSSTTYAVVASTRRSCSWRFRSSGAACKRTRREARTTVRPGRCSCSVQRCGAACTESTRASRRSKAAI